MQVKPELLSKIQDFLQGSRADKTALAALHREAFGYPLNDKCGLCINDAIKALNGLLNIKTKPEKQKTMGQYNWTTDKKFSDAIVTVKVGDRKQNIGKANLTDDAAAIIAGIPKYSHLVVENEPAKPETPELGVDEMPNAEVENDTEDAAETKPEPDSEYITGVVKEESEPVGNVEPASNGSEELQADTLTSKEQPSEEKPAKAKKGKQK